jgi:hypothetical protein
MRLRCGDRNAVKVGGNGEVGMGLKSAKVKNGESVLSRIVGARLTSVDFVLDHLILGFDGKGALTALVWPEISIAGDVVKFGMQGYRDRLCELITEVISEVRFSEDETITISFGDNNLRIPLQQRRAPGERAIFTAPTHFLHVW